VVNRYDLIASTAVRGGQKNRTNSLRDRRAFLALLDDERLLRVRIEGPRSENFDAFM